VDSNAVQKLLFSRVASMPLGTVLLSSLDRVEAKGAMAHFLTVVFEDMQLRTQNVTNIRTLNNLIMAAAKRRVSSDLAVSTRRALVVIGYLISAAKVDVEHPTSDRTVESTIKLPCIPKISEAEDCLLNAVYSCEDPEVLVAVGRYLLELFDADFHTAFDYFTYATEIDSSRSRVEICDRLVKEFSSSRGMLYALAGLGSRLDAWNEHKRKLGEG